MSNVIAGVRLPANAVPMVRRHLEHFSQASREDDVHFIQAELFGMLMMLEQLQRLSCSSVSVLFKHVRDLANERVKALRQLAIHEGVSPARAGG